MTTWSAAAAYKGLAVCGRLPWPSRQLSWQSASLAWRGIAAELGRACGDVRCGMRLRLLLLLLAPSGPGNIGSRSSLIAALTLRARAAFWPLPLADEGGSWKAGRGCLGVQLMARSADKAAAAVTAGDGLTNSGGTAAKSSRLTCRRK